MQWQLVVCRLQHHKKEKRNASAKTWGWWAWWPSWEEAWEAWAKIKSQQSGDVLGKIWDFYCLFIRAYTVQSEHNHLSICSVQCKLKISISWKTLFCENLIFRSKLFYCSYCSLLTVCLQTHTVHSKFNCSCCWLLTLFVLKTALFIQICKFRLKKNQTSTKNKLDVHWLEINDCLLFIPKYLNCILRSICFMDFFDFDRFSWIFSCTIFSVSSNSVSWLWILSANFNFPMLRFRRTLNHLRCINILQYFSQSLRCTENIREDFRLTNKRL